MMGIIVPETCWASNKICNKKHLLHLVGILFPHTDTTFLGRFSTILSEGKNLPFRSTSRLKNLRPLPFARFDHEETITTTQTFMTQRVFDVFWPSKCYELSLFAPSALFNPIYTFQGCFIFYSTTWLWITSTRNSASVLPVAHLLLINSRNNTQVRTVLQKGKERPRHCSLTFRGRCDCGINIQRQIEMSAQINGLNKFRETTA